MGLTLIERILLKHSNDKKLSDFVYADVDFCFGNDITAPLAVKEFNAAGFDSVFNPRKIGFFCDHFVPARDLKAANNVKLLKEFARKWRLRHFYESQACGIEHAFIPEAGIVKPYDLVIGADSHTCTYGAMGAASFGVGSTDVAAAMKEGKCWLRVPEVIKFIYHGKLNKWVSGKDLILYTIGKIGVDGALYKVMEMSGPVIKSMSMDERFTMCNMAIEAGGKTGIIEPDEKTAAFAKSAGKRNKKIKLLKSDSNADYSRIIEIDVSKIKPQVSCPHLPSNTKDAGSLKSVKLNQVVIGSCTNGRISDLKIAAGILKGKKIKKGLRAIVIPATPKIYQEAEKKGLLRVFAESGCMICPPTCGPCLGGHTGVLDKGEVALATTNRNFIGRMGHPESFVYLSSPAVAAASAVKGRIVHPDEV
ncbi:MAG: 3-isopropylmalate dehydratase large subunit [Candidatus Omnitrophota bacterium]